MTGERFTVKLRQGATIYSIMDYYGELPLSEGIYYKSNAEKLCKWLNTQHELLNAFCKENEQLKKQIEEYTNPDKYILIKKTESSTEEYNSCPDCQHYEREYEEIIAFGEYETLTKEICNKGHDIEDTDANKCNDYEYNKF